MIYTYAGSVKDNETISNITVKIVEDASSTEVYNTTFNNTSNVNPFEYNPGSINVSSWNSGAYTVTITATDKCGEVATTTLNFTRECDTPSITLIQAAEIPGLKYAFSGSVSDYDIIDTVTVKFVEVATSTSPIADEVFTNSASANPFSFSNAGVDISSWTDGDYTVTFTVLDKCGKTAVETRTFNKGCDVPVINITTNNYDGTDYTIAGDVTDAETTDNVKIDIVEDSTSTNKYTNTLNNTTSANPFNFSDNVGAATIATFSPGVYNVTVTATDSCSKTNTYTTTFKICDTPTLNITTSTVNGNNYDYAGNVVDNVDITSTVTVKIVDAASTQKYTTTFTNSGNNNPFNFSGSVDFSSWNDDTYTVTFTATDNCSKTATDTKTFVKSSCPVTTAPTLLYPEDGFANMCRWHFRWTIVSGADQYEVIAMNSDGTTTELDVTFNVADVEQASNLVSHIDQYIDRNDTLDRVIRIDTNANIIFFTYDRIEARTNVTWKVIARNTTVPCEKETGIFTFTSKSPLELIASTNIDPASEASYHHPNGIDVQNHTSSAIGNDGWKYFYSAGADGKDHVDKFKWTDQSLVTSYQPVSAALGTTANYWYADDVAVTTNGYVIVTDTYQSSPKRIFTFNDDGSLRANHESIIYNPGCQGTEYNIFRDFFLTTCHSASYIYRFDGNAFDTFSGTLTNTNYTTRIGSPTEIAISYDGETIYASYKGGTYHSIAKLELGTNTNITALPAAELSWIRTNRTSTNTSLTDYTNQGLYLIDDVYVDDIFDDNAYVYAGDYNYYASGTPISATDWAKLFVVKVNSDGSASHVVTIDDAPGTSSSFGSGVAVHFETGFLHTGNGAPETVYTHCACHGSYTAPASGVYP